MTEQSSRSNQSQDPPQIHVLSPEDARSIVEMDPSEARKLMGGIALEGAVGLVVERDERGAERPVKLVNLSERDLGTSINPESNNASKYPSLKEAYDRVVADRGDSVEGDGADGDVFDGEPLQAKLNEFDSLTDDLYNGVEMSQNELDGAIRSVDTLLKDLRRKESDGSWSGNKLSNHQDIVRKAQDMAVTLHRMAEGVEHSVVDGEDAGSKVKRYSTMFDETTEAPMGESDKAKHVSQTAGAAGEDLRNLARELSGLDDVRVQELRTVASALDSLANESYMTVSDASSTVANLKRRLDDVFENGARAVTLVGTARDTMAALQRALTS